MPLAHRHPSRSELINASPPRPLGYTHSEMSAIAVVGTGYVGLTSAACFAELGHQVTGLDIDEAKVAALKQGQPTIYEPGLEELLTQGLKSGRLGFTTRYEDAIPNAEFVFLAVGTPMGRRG